MPLSRLLAEHPGARRLAGPITVRLLETTDDHGTVEVYALALVPGAVHVSPGHGPGVVEHLLVTRGAVRAGRSGHEAELGTGEATRWPADGEHTYAALAGEPAAAVLVIRTPPTP
ncbi:Helix-turn-helix regulator [Pseudonocardia sp. Ae717_Ps2]|uniref:hypothetical protein n=1 Tax=Pseudonocardia sp. Ae717_Ps2 TaxID=1885573 RepID=UPI0009675FF5|nr:hypothetical protein [Pseudonocardia sp. Ae717_Ps2]OLM27622.1 Helix-turn-helix regulator [Pseudonocardia sp. Ae717_Ps2]